MSRTCGIVLPRCIVFIDEIDAIGGQRGGTNGGGNDERPRRDTLVSMHPGSGAPHDGCTRQ